MLVFLESFYSGLDHGEVVRDWVTLVGVCLVSARQQMLESLTRGNPNRAVEQDQIYSWYCTDLSAHLHRYSYTSTSTSQHELIIYRNEPSQCLKPKVKAVPSHEWFLKQVQA